MENEKTVFPMITPPMKTKRFFLYLFILGVFLTLESVGIALFVIHGFQSEADITDVLWGSNVFIGYFIIVDLILLYYLLSYSVYYSSTVEIDNCGIKRVRNGIVKEQYLWKDVAAFYMNSSPSNSSGNWVILAARLLDKPSKKMFHIRGYLGIRLSSRIIMQFGYSDSIESALERFAVKRKL